MYTCLSKFTNAFATKQTYVHNNASFKYAIQNSIHIETNNNIIIFNIYLGHAINNQPAYYSTDICTYSDSSYAYVYTVYRYIAVYSYCHYTYISGVVIVCRLSTDDQGA